MTIYLFGMLMLGSIDINQLRSNKMDLSRKGRLEICHYEGLALRPYKDTEGVWTIGIGHTKYDKGLNPSTMHPTDTITPKQAVDMFNKDIQRHIDRVNKYIKSPLTQEQFDALVSFDYNTYGISDSTLTKYVNEGRRSEDIITAFMMWTKNKELVKRRTNEKNLFIYGDYIHTGKITLWQTNGNGKLLTSGAKEFNLEEYF